MTGLPDVSTLLGWAAAGQRRVEKASAELGNDDVRAASALPGWTRGHVLTHLARNADALVNLLAWARTGTPTPMYDTAQQRERDIESGAGRAATEQLADLRDTAARFASVAEQLPDSAWSAEVTSAQGRTISAAEVPWMRTREVWIHLVDLDIDVGFDVFPDDIAIALVRDVAGALSAKIAQPVELNPRGHDPIALGPQAGGPPVDRWHSHNQPVVVTGPANHLAGWLTGRTDGAQLTCETTLPTLPRWL